MSCFCLRGFHYSFDQVQGKFDLIKIITFVLLHFWGIASSLEVVWDQSSSAFLPKNEPLRSLFCGRDPLCVLKGLGSSH